MDESSLQMVQKEEIRIMAKKLFAVLGCYAAEGGSWLPVF